MKAKKSNKKYVKGGIAPQPQGPAILAPRNSKIFGSSDLPANPMLRTTKNVVESAVQPLSAAEMAKAGGVRGENIGRNTKLAQNIAGGALQAANAVIPGIGLAAPIVTGAIGLIGAGAAKRAAARLPEPSDESPKAVMDRLQAMQDKTLMDRKVDEFNRSMATGVEALQMGSGREIGQISNLLRAQQEGIQSAVAEQQQREDRAQDLVAQTGIEMQQRREDRIQQERAGLQQEYSANIQGVLGSLGQLGSAAIQAKYSGTGGTAEKGMKTPGAFSHKTNPLMIVAKNGAAVGEMTGGEVILNPKQTKQVAKQSTYMRNLLKKPRFKNG